MRVLLLDEAERELLDAIRWYDDQQTGLGHDFEQEVFKMVDRIRQNPLLGSLVEVLPDCDDVRRMAAHRFPYHVIYDCSGLPDEVRVFAVAHERRRPDYWLDRLGG